LDLFRHLYFKYIIMEKGGYHIMYTNKTSTALVIIAIVRAISLVTTGSLTASVLSAKTKKGTTSATTKRGHELLLK
jgi:histidine ammonia-lyase